MELHPPSAVWDIIASVKEIHFYHVFVTSYYREKLSFYRLASVNNKYYNPMTSNESEGLY